VDLFAAADRDGDGKLTLKEMEAFLDLIEEGVAAQAVVVVHDRGRNLFDALDGNRDGRLDLGELNQAVKVLGDRASLTIDQSPRHVAAELAARRSGGLVRAAAPAGPASAPRRGLAAGEGRAPAGFRRWTATCDGYLSPREFLGSPARFRELDADGDGRISVAEAEQAEKRKAGEKRP